MLDGCLPRWSKAQPSSSSPPPSPSPDRTVLSWHFTLSRHPSPSHMPVCPVLHSACECMFVCVCVCVWLCVCACACACAQDCVLLCIVLAKGGILTALSCPFAACVCVCVCVFVCVCVVCMSSVALNVRVCGEDCARVCANCGRVVC